MAEELKESGTVTATSVVGFVFGLIGMLGSFIPCLGAAAFYISIPAAIISGIALGIAYSQNAKRTFAIVAVTISLIGVVVSGVQFFSIISEERKVQRSFDNMRAQFEQSAKPTVATTPSPKNDNVQKNSEQISVTDRIMNSIKKIFISPYIGKWQNVKHNESIEIKKNGESFLLIEGNKIMPLILQSDGTLLLPIPGAPCVISYMENSDTIVDTLVGRKDAYIEFKRLK